MSNYNHLQGDGLIDWLKNLKNVVLNPVSSLSVIPKEVKDFLEKYGNHKIAAMKVCRDPLNSKIIQVADLATKGQFSLNAKQLNYDDIFHRAIQGDAKAIAALPSAAEEMLRAARQ